MHYYYERRNIHASEATSAADDPLHGISVYLIF